VGVSGTLQPIYPWKRASVLIIKEALWAPRLVWTGMEKIKTDLSVNISIRYFTRLG
jgi:hypothetical protein